MLTIIGFILLGLVGLVVLMILFGIAPCAETDVSGFDGAVTLPSGHGGAPYAWRLGVSMNKKPVNRYGDSRFSRSRGGIFTLTGSISFFLRQGAAGTSPGLVAAEADGSPLTLTATSGCLYSGDALFDGDINHRYDDPAIEGTYNFTFTGTVLETWALV